MMATRDNGPSTLPKRERRERIERRERPSLLMAGIGQRLAGAAALLVLLWLAVGWALGGES